ncbi:COP9 signalosome complex subunit 6 [Cichlidogyrus casuarinus]|uniref:COP9 signalosome complex subunit 6 n=1 Tax=Cichlidogyrus casuarinus TaxID=1844966 RepID=A0ABD2PY05_9PLAT
MDASSQNAQQNAVLASTGALMVRLHPMVIFNISEHWTRYKVMSDGDATLPIKVFGALLGKQDGNQLEIVTSMELLLDAQSGHVDSGFFRTRESQSKLVHPDLDFIGCYITGGPIQEEDQSFQIQMQELCESVVILKLDPYDRRGDQLPIHVYESAVDNDARLHFKQVPYELAHDEAERIGVDHIAKTIGTGSSNAGSLTAEHLLGSYHAMEMLLLRLNILQNYVDAVNNKELPVNHCILREISGLIHRLPFLMNKGTDRSAISAKTQLYRQANEVCLTVLLSSMTQGLQSLHSTLIKSLQVLDKKPLTQSGHMHHMMNPTWSNIGSYSHKSAKRLLTKSGSKME